MQYLVCRAGTQMIGLDVHDIRHILPLPKTLAKAPLAGHIIDGLFALRGRGVAVLRLDDTLHDPASPYCVIVERHNELYGLKVIAIEGVMTLDIAAAAEPTATMPPVLQRAGTALFRYGDGLLTVLNTNALLQGEKS